MSRGQLEVLGLLTAVTSLMLLVTAAGRDCWRQGAKDPVASVGLSLRCRGLWGECVYDSLVSLRTCDVSVSYMEHLPVDMLVMRVTLVGMGVLSVVSILIMIPGLKCTTLVPGVQEQSSLLRVSGALCVCGGLCGAVGLLWYGVDTYTRYKQEAALQTPGITFEFGLSYWLTVGGAVCCLASAAMVLRSTSCTSDAAAQTDSVASPPTTRNHTTYV